MDDMEVITDASSTPYVQIECVIAHGRAITSACDTYIDFIDNYVHNGDAHNPYGPVNVDGRYRFKCPLGNCTTTIELGEENGKAVVMNTSRDPGHMRCD